MPKQTLGFDTTFGDILSDNSGDIFEAIFIDNFIDIFVDNFNDTFNATFDNTFDAIFDAISIDSSGDTSDDIDIPESIAPRKYKQNVQNAIMRILKYRITFLYSHIHNIHSILFSFFIFDTFLFLEFP